MQNKAHFARKLNELELPQPETVFLSEASQLDRDWDVSVLSQARAHSTAGAGVFLVKDRPQLDELAKTTVT